MKTKVVQHVPRINISMSQTQSQSQTQTNTHRFPAFVMLTLFSYSFNKNVANFLNQQNTCIMIMVHYDVIRRDLLSKIPDLDEDFLNWDSNRQLKFLSCDPSSVKLTAQYIIDAFDLRSTIL